MKKKTTFATLKGRMTFDADIDLKRRRIIFDDPEAVEAELFDFRKQYDADPERYEEDVQALLLTLQGVKVSKIRAHPLVKHKLESERTYRQRLRRLQAQFKQELSRDRIDRINSFIDANWDELETIPNPYGLPGLCAWWPSAAVELMKRAGVLRHNSHEIYDAKWFKKRRQRLHRRPAPRYLVKLSRSPRELVVFG